MNPVSPLQQAFDLQYLASRQHPEVPAMVRKERLLRVQRMLDEHGPVLTAAVQADFGIRSPQLTEFADLLVLRSQLKQALRRLERWMRPATSGPRCTCCRRVRASSASRWAWWASFPLELPAAAVAGPGHHRAGGGQP
jgi:hypothetical protein